MAKVSSRCEVWMTRDEMLAPQLRGVDDDPRERLRGGRRRAFGRDERGPTGDEREG